MKKLSNTGSTVQVKTIRNHNFQTKEISLQNIIFGMDLTFKIRIYLQIFIKLNMTFEMILHKNIRNFRILDVRMYLRWIAFDYFLLNN